VRLRRFVVFRLLRLCIRLGWPMRLVAPLFGRWNPFDPERLRDPYPGYRRLQESAPVYRNPLLRIWILSRYADVAAVLRDPSFSVRRLESAAVRRLGAFQKLRPDFREMLERNLLMLDPPDHTRLRGLVAKAFTPRVVERLRPRIQALVDGLLDDAERRGEIELMRDFAYPLPATVIAELLGVPAADGPRFMRWSNDLAALLDPFNAPGGLDAAQAAFVELSGYFRAALAERRREPRDDLLSALASVEERGESLSEAELVSLAGLILGAGYETTANLIGNATVALLRNPGERKRLAEDPGLVASAVEEFLRYESPVQATDRVATRDFEIRGTRIRRGELVVLFLAAANRDPERFPEPDRLDLGRRDNAHLAFSQGPHFCLGAQLARAEAQIAIGTLVRRFPDLEGPPGPIAWRPSFTLRGPSALPIRLR
jgi:cytochrome P450